MRTRDTDCVHHRVCHCPVVECHPAAHRGHRGHSAPRPQCTAATIVSDQDRQRSGNAHHQDRKRGRAWRARRASRCGAIGRSWALMRVAWRVTHRGVAPDAAPPFWCSSSGVGRRRGEGAGKGKLRRRCCFVRLDKQQCYCGLAGRDTCAASVSLGVWGVVLRRSWYGVGERRGEERGAPPPSSSHPPPLWKSTCPHTATLHLLPPHGCEWSPLPCATWLLRPPFTPPPTTYQQR